MCKRTRRLVGLLNLMGSLLAVVCLLEAYGLAEQLVVDQEAAGSGALAMRTVTWWGPDFSVTLTMSLLMVGAAAGLVGSMIQQSIIFALRAGHKTLEESFVWWYLLRPVWSALLGSVVVVAVNAGLISIGDVTTSAAGVTVLVTMGAVAGLYTDAALERLRPLLRASDPAKTVEPADASSKAPGGSGE